MKLGRLFVRFLALMVVVFPATAFACECSALSSLPQRYGYPFILIGKVTAIESKPSQISMSPDGRIASISISLEGTTRVAVERQLRGASVREMQIPRTGSDCDAVLVQGETYLFYDSAADGSSVNLCNPPVPLAEATEDLKYIEGLRTGQSQAILYGWVTQEIGGVPSPAPGDISVVMEGGRRQFRQSYSQNRGYQIVAPPGDYQVWLEKEGIRLTTPQTIRLRNGDISRRQLTIRS